MVSHLRDPFLLAQRSCSEFCRGISTKLPVWDAIGLWSNRNEALVLLISGPYLYAASMAEMRRESTAVLPGDGFDALRYLHSNGII